MSICNLLGTTGFYAIRTAALIEAAKGTLVLALGVGLASGLRRHAQHLLGRWAAHVDSLAHPSHVLARVGDLLNKVDAPVVLAEARRLSLRYASLQLSFQTALSPAGTPDPGTPPTSLLAAQRQRYRRRDAAC
jgi:hypothetical protein